MTDASPDGRQPAPQWKRIVLKLSGEALSGHGASPDSFSTIRFHCGAG